MTTLQPTLALHPRLAPAAAQLRASLGLAMIPLFAGLTALAAQVQVPIPGTPIPMTLQSLPVYLGAVALGARRGTAAMALYLALGLVGLPAFADGTSGAHIIFGASGGYLLGFLLAPFFAATAQSLVTTRHAALSALLGLLGAHIAVFGVGLVWLKFVAGVTWSETLALGLWPFLLGDAIKTGLALAIASMTLRVRRPAAHTDSL